MPYNSQELLDQKARFYNRIYRSALMILVLVCAVSMVIGVRRVFVVSSKIDRNIEQTQSIINSNQASALTARKANVQRQEDLKNYVKCITLARFDNPELVSPTVTKQQVSDALDKCAKVE